MNPSYAIETVSKNKPSYLGNINKPTLAVIFCKLLVSVEAYDMYNENMHLPHSHAGITLRPTDIF